MKSKSITLVLGGVILCTTIVISTLFLNSPHSSHAASRLSTATNLQSSLYASPTNGILSGNVFYGSNGSSVYALNATTGALIWKYHLTGYASALLLGLHQGTVFIGLYNGPQDNFLAALQATNGSLVWLSAQKWIYPPEISSFQVVNGHIYFLYNAGEASVLYAFNANNGSYLWYSGAFGMVISQGSIYTYDYYLQGGPPDPTICALNANDGSMRWCYHDASMVVSNDPMLLYVNGIVYANSYSSTGPVTSYAVALNANDGSLLWSVAGMKIASVVQTIAFATNQNGAEALNASNGSLLVKYQNASYLFSHNGIVYAVDSNNDLVAFRQSDGSLLWHYNFLGLNTCLPPMNGVLYCLSSNTEFALNATNGTFLWKYSLGSVGFPSPCPYAFNNVLYCIGNGNQTLFALNATSGTLLWKHGLTECPTISSGCFDLSPGLLTSLNGITYVLSGTETNNIFVVHVHAYNAMTGTLLWKY